MLTMKSKKTVWEGYALCDSDCWHSEAGRTMQTVQWPVTARSWERGERAGWGTDKFQGRGTLSGYRSYIYLNTQDEGHRHGKPSCKPWTWGCQWSANTGASAGTQAAPSWGISCDTGSSVLRDGDSGQGWAGKQEAGRDAALSAVWLRTLNLSSKSRSKCSIRFPWYSMPELLVTIDASELTNRFLSIFLRSGTFLETCLSLLLM